MASSDLDQLQAVLGPSYVLTRELGRGGMATVYLAHDTKHGRLVALKVLRADLASQLGPERFRREIATAAQLQHPHILGLHDSGETSAGQLWFTMPFVEGESLRDRLRREKQLPVEDAVRIAREVASALDYAHARGVIHRDVKPENVLLTQQGDALLSDFGIARALHATDGPGLTETGLAPGTPQYMSPEQASGERALDGRSDVYALGAVCYETLAGEPPFVGNSSQAVVAKMLSGHAPSVRVLRPDVSPALDAALQRALALTPADRWATAGALAEALAMATQPGAQPARRMPTRRVRMGAALLGVGVLAVLGTLFAWRPRGGGAVTAGATSAPVGLAVLPFDNEGDTANGYFATGITSEIRGKLSALPALRLIASSSCNQYLHTQKSAEQIGRELGVRYLLTGRVQWEHGVNGSRRVRVSPELIEVRDGGAPAITWQRSYDTTLADVFDVQTAVATQVADRLGVVLSQPAQTRLAAHPTQNLAAYDAYLRSTVLDGMDPATVRRALVAADEAIALDSGFAAAWARTSWLHSLLYLSSLDQADADAAHQAAERAVTLAPTAPEGYLARGYYDYFISHDLAANRAAYETAVRLAPSSSEAISALGSAEARSGQWSAALGHAREATVLDPRAVLASLNLTRLLFFLRRYHDARAEAERGLTVAPASLVLISYRAESWLNEGELANARTSLRDVPPTLDRATLAVYVSDWWLDSADRALVLTLPPSAFDNDRGEWGIVRATFYWLSGDTLRARRYADSALLTLESQLRATPDQYYLLPAHALALAYLGRTAAAEREGERGLALAQTTGDEFVGIPYARQGLARIYVVAGNYPRALDQLDSLVDKPSWISPALLRIDPTWAPLRGDARFERLISRSVTTEAPAG